MSSHTTDTIVEECGDELAIMSAHSLHAPRNSETAPLLKGRVSDSSVKVRSADLMPETNGSHLRRRCIVSRICGEPNNITPRRWYLGDDFISSQYESLNYEKPDNKVPSAEKRNIRKWTSFTSVSLTRWVITFMVGLFTGVVVSGIDYFIELLSGWKIDTIKQTYPELLEVISWMEKHPDQEAVGCVVVYVVWLAISVFLVSIVAFMVVFLAPIAAGSGIPEIKCYLNGIRIPEIVRLKTLFVKASGIIFAVAGGLPVGKEGPMIHTGAAVAAGMSQGRLTPHDKFKLDCTKCVLPVFEEYRNDPEKRDFVASGAAAGVAAAFGAPIGGVLFSLEEGASFVNQSLTWRMFFASMTTTFFLNLILSWIKGHPGDLTYAGIINFGHFPTESVHSYQWFELPIFVLLGVIGGLLGALFNFINRYMTLFRRRYIRTRLMKFLEPLLVVTITVTASYLTMFLSSECRPLGTQEEYQDSYGGPSKLFCGDGEYNTISTVFLNTPETSIKNLFHDSSLSYSWKSLAFYGCLYFFLATWTYGLMVSSGLFVPSLLVGATWGRLIGYVINQIPGYSWSTPGRYALVGASAMLGGVVRMTISITVIVIEATQDTTYGLPIMLSIMVAKWVGDLFGEGLYDIHIALNSIPLLPWEPSPHSVDIPAKDIMSKPPVKTMQMCETVGRIVRVLKENKHQGFPVVDGVEGKDDEGNSTYGTFKGIILRSQLVILLQYRATIRDKGLLTSEAFSMAYPRFPQTVDVDQSEWEQEIDLTPYMNRSAYCAFGDFHYPWLFSQFRNVGMRHLVIVNRQNQVIGMVTRKDLAKYEFHFHQCCSRVKIKERKVIY